MGKHCVYSGLALTICLGFLAGCTVPGENTARAAASSTPSTASPTSTSNDDPVPAAGVCFERGLGYRGGPEVPCSKPHSDEVVFTWAETASGRHNPTALNHHAYDVCEATLTSPQRDTSTDSPAIIVWFPNSDDWAAAADKGLPVTFACGWHYVHDYTDFADAMRLETAER